ncbi:MAG: prolipoprotein diacylglyceryl transferase [Candidatus Pelagibacter bacterium]|jgi:phosphatidylglycerol:prolipoprotein diacylglycerol transferase|nr:prolipoprotein diacylglyceryl transferase [Candidatus Pelagibacter bacterium]
MFTNNFDPVAFQIFSVEIRWYSLSYIFGIILGWFYCKKFLIKDKKINNLFDDLITYLILGIIIGGRLGYVIFYNPVYYSKNLIEIFMIWNGGMSFHGGVLGTIIATYIFGKKNNINCYIFLDLIAMSAPIGIFLGRISNFINSELYGRQTDIFWAVIFKKIDNLSRHPSQIYEAFFEGIILFILLNFTFKKYFFKSPGIISSIFIIFYSLFRFLIEFTREPDAQLGFIFLNFTLGQIISIIFFIAGLSLFYKKNES